ncbi:MAG: pseudouridine-5'-phosphate glycosidase [Planctomycetota bacterium]
MTIPDLINRAEPNAVALETTLLVHGMPRERVHEVAAELSGAVIEAGAQPALVGIVDGVPVVGMTSADLDAMLARDEVAKVNRANLGVILATKQWGATTVSTTAELAHAAGVRVFATGGIGGVHRGYGTQLDISADLAAFAAHTVAVVTSGCKNILDIAATREALETLGVPVVGYQTDAFPAFYQRSSGIAIDAKFDDVDELAAFLAFELDRTGRGVVVCNPIPAEDEIPLEQWDRWLAQAEAKADARGRDATPQILAAIHRISNGATVDANIALARSNAALAGRLAAAMASS